jgi:hypothetical protein
MALAYEEFSPCDGPEAPGGGNDEIPILEPNMLTFSNKSQHSTLNSQHSTLNTQHSTLNTQHSTLDTRHSTLNTQHSTLNTQKKRISPLYRKSSTRFKQSGRHVSDVRDVWRRKEARGESGQGSFRNSNPPYQHLVLVIVLGAQHKTLNLVFGTIRSASFPPITCLLERIQRTGAWILSLPSS